MKNSEQHIDSQNTRQRAFISTFAILGSRIFGLVREQIFAFFFGASAVLDAYVVAFRIPNLLRDLLAEGALSQSFVSIFSKKLSVGEKDKAIELAHKIQTLIITIMLIITFIGIVFAPYIVSGIAPGFSDEKRQLTIMLTRVVMPFILFVAIAAHAMGILNSFNKYFIPHSASTVFNITSVVFGLVLIAVFVPDYFWGNVNHHWQNRQNWDLASQAIMWMTWGIVFGGVCQYLIQVPELRRQGFQFHFDFHFNTEEVREALKLTGPAILGGSAVQINVLVNSQFASTLPDGSMSALSFAFRFMQLPLGLFGVAIASASAPTFAKLLAQNRAQDFRHMMQSSIRLCLFLCLPATCALIVFGEPIIGLIYEHGRFSEHDTLMTAQALSAYAFGVTSYSLIKLYQPAFLAFNDSKKPMMVSLFSILVNYILNYFFVVVLNWGHWSLALSTSLLATLNFVLLCWIFSGHMSGVWSLNQVQSLLKILCAVILASFAGYLTLHHIPWSLGRSFLLFSTQFILSGSVFCAVYFLICFILNIEEVSWILNKLKIKKIEL